MPNPKKRPAEFQIGPEGDGEEDAPRIQRSHDKIFSNNNIVAMNGECNESESENIPLRVADSTTQKLVVETETQIEFGFSVYAKVNPFATVMSGKSAHSFLDCSKTSDKPFCGTFNSISTSSGSLLDAPKSGSLLSVQIPIESPKTPKSNPFASISPSHNPFMSIIPGKDEAFKAVAASSAAASPASISSTTASNSQNKINVFSFIPPKKATCGLSGFAAVTHNGPGLAFGSTSASTSSSSLKTHNSSDNLVGKSDQAKCNGEDPEEDLTPATFGKIYTLAGGPIITGEEGEECIFEVRTKLYRLSYNNPLPTPSSTENKDDNDSIKDGCSSKEDASKNNVTSEWIEIGVGPARLLKSLPLPETADTPSSQKQKVRIVMRREEKKGGHGT